VGVRGSAAPFGARTTLRNDSVHQALLQQVTSKVWHSPRGPGSAKFFSSAGDISEITGKQTGKHQTPIET